MIQVDGAEEACKAVPVVAAKEVDEGCRSEEGVVDVEGCNDLRSSITSALIINVDLKGEVSEILTLSISCSSTSIVAAYVEG